MRKVKNSTVRPACAAANNWKFLHWSFEDPAGADGSDAERLDVFRRVRDQIIANIEREFVQGEIERKRA